MANEKVNKVVLGNETLIDLTSDTVTANNLLSGATAHDSRGEQIQGAVSVPTDLDDLSDVSLSSPASGDVLFNDGTEWINKNILKPVTQAEYDALVQAGTVDPDVDYHITDVDVSFVDYIETSVVTALTGATTATFTNSHIAPTKRMKIVAEPASCKTAGSTQYVVKAKFSTVGNGTATIIFPALAENTDFKLLINAPETSIEIPYQTFEFDVTNLSLTTVAGALYYGVQQVDTGIDLTNKKYFVSAVLSADVFVSIKKVSGSNTKLQVTLYRVTALTGVSGKIYVMLTD